MTSLVWNYCIIHYGDLYHRSTYIRFDRTCQRDTKKYSKICQNKTTQFHRIREKHYLLLLLQQSTLADRATCHNYNGVYQQQWITEIKHPPHTNVMISEPLILPRVLSSVAQSTALNNCFFFCPKSLLFFAYTCNLFYILVNGLLCCCIFSEFNHQIRGS